MDQDLKFMLILVGMGFVGVLGMGLIHLQESETRLEYQRHIDSVEHVIDSLETQNDSLELMLESAQRLDIPTWAYEAVHKASEDEEVPLPLASRLIAVESSWRPRVVSSAGAVGLTQIKPSTARMYDSTATMEKLKRVEYNLHLGFRYLRDLYDQTRNWHTALRMYNAGPSRALRAHKTGEYDGSSYARKVMGK